ncbi:MAG: EamA family transporter [Gammaproteobacteria bacterium]|nr:EamA family transporter [Gammaproteobacteria bacterium]
MSRDRDERAALLYALAAVAAWSTVATGFKLGLGVLAPLQLLLLGTVISTALFAVLATATGCWHPGRRTLVTGATFGLVNPFLYYLVLFEAYDRLPAQIAQPLNYTWAIVLALLAVPVLKQPLSGRLLAGITVGYLGVLILLTQGRLDAWPDLDWAGVGLALASTLLWAGYWLGNARVDLPPVTLMAWSFLAATPLVAIACALGPGLPALTWERLGYGAWVGLIEMGFTFLLWQQAMRRTRHAGRTGQLIFLSPFLSLVLIGTVLGEDVHWTSAAGLAVIVAGLLLTREKSGGAAAAPEGPER